MYSENAIIKDEHIDFQGILDSLYYPFYMETVRHDYMKKVHNIDIQQAAKEGKLYVLLSYEIKFKNSLKKGDNVKVTCELKPISNLKFGFHQKMISNDKVCAEADFVCTCVPAGGGKPSLPPELKNILNTI